MKKYILTGVNGLAFGLYTNSLALGLRVDFFKVDVTLSTGTLPGSLPCWSLVTIFSSWGGTCPCFLGSLTGPSTDSPELRLKSWPNFRNSACCSSRPINVTQ